MAGLLSDVLPFVYSRADALKRRVGGLLGDPVGTLTQAVNDANDRAGGLLSQTRAAADEGLNYGPATQSLAQSIAAAYTPMGITVYHGSPHKFTKFDSSKIGTGEGAQAYGHGLYLAESPEVAKQYANELGTRVYKDGKLIQGHGAPQQWNSSPQYSSNTDLNDFLTMSQGDAAMARRELLKTAREMRQAKSTEGLRDYQEALAELRNVRGSISRQGDGQVYKVDLPDSAVARMLDWDKPLSQQAQNVKASLDALKKANPQGYQRLVDAQLGGPLMDQAAGMDLYRNLIKGANERQMAEVMRQQGIPGIRYLDGGSRGLGGGTSNFVVFPGEESLLTILERNGAPVR